jgi:hypothetical protein
MHIYAYICIYTYIHVYIYIFIYTGHTITIANIGDSRITLGSKRNTKIIEKDMMENPHLPNSLLEATPLSIDHKPSIQSEKERILLSGGRVFSVEYEDGTKGPERVWLSHMNIPGYHFYVMICVFRKIFVQMHVYICTF